MKIAIYLLSLLTGIVILALAVEFGLRAFMPDLYRGYLIAVDDDYVKWRMGPFEPSQAAIGFNEPIKLKKPADTLRVIVLGTSSTEGWLTAKTVYKKYNLDWQPKGISSYSKAMQYILNDIADPSSKKVEVINLGIAAYNMTDVFRMLKDSLRLEPDLLIIQIGGNETWTAERYSWESYIDENIPYLYTALGYEVLTQRKAGWQTLSTGGGAFNPMALFGSAPQPIVPEPPDREAGLRERQAVYRRELARLGKFLQKIDVPFLFQIPAPNLAGHEPFGSMAKVGSSAETIEELNQKLIAALQSDGSTAKQSYLEILAIDDGIAEANFQLGRIYLDEQDPDLARRHFWKAVDRDLVLKRLPSSFRDISLEFVRSNNFAYVDEMLFFESGTPSGVLGYNRLDDDVHPSREAQYDLASRLVELIVSNQFLPQEDYAGNLQNMPGISDYDLITGFDNEAIGQIAYLKAAHNYLSFGRFGQRLRWHPKPKEFLQPIIDELDVANQFAPTDFSRYMSAVLNLYLGEETNARRDVDALNCQESEARAAQIASSIFNASRQMFGPLDAKFTDQLSAILADKGCSK